MHTACVWSENYRLQSIQLSKICRGAALPEPLRALARENLFKEPTFANLRGAKVGGEYRARTGDLLVANQALSQLS